MKKGFTPLNTEGSGLKKARNLIGFTSLNIKIKDSGSKARNLTGFTLIELLVVIAIISVIVTLATIALNTTRAKGRDAKRVSDIKQIQTALEMYKNDSNNYPLAVTSGNSLVYSTQTYLKTVPVAPGKPDGTCATDVYTYTYYPATGIYEITYCLGGVINTIGPGNAKATPGNIYTSVPAVVPFVCGSSVTGKGSDVQVYGTVTAADGKCWFDRNLGATQVATASNDYLAYGSLFQWGRAADSHQLITWTGASSGTAVNSSTDVNADAPANSLFIKETDSPWDWRVNQDDTLWASSASTNNPCPTGWHVPTSAEWAAVANPAGVANDITSIATGFNSALKLTAAGMRLYSNASITSQVGTSRYWSSSPSGSSASSFYLAASSVIADNPNNRGNGLSVRCVQD